MQRLLSILALIVLLVAPGAARAQQVELGRYYALVVGVNDYRKMPKLQTAVNDASAVHDLLRREFGFTSELLLNAKRADIISALDRYRRQLKPGDNFLLYYAGHGQLDADADAGYWLPADADPDSQVNWIALQSLTSTLRALPAKHVMVVSDSCFSGMLARGPLTASLGANERSADIARMSAKRARTVLASGGLEPVMDAGGDGHSVFTRAFLQVLRETSEPIIGHELYNQLRPRVVVNSPQTPEYADIRMAGHDGGDFVFMPYNKTRAPTPAPATTSMQPAPAQDMAASYELAFWDAIKDSNRPEDYRAYLEAYPNGRFAPLARVRGGQTLAAAPPRAAPVQSQPVPSQPAPSQPAQSQPAPSQPAAPVVVEPRPAPPPAPLARPARRVEPQRAETPPARPVAVLPAPAPAPAAPAPTAPAPAAPAAIAPAPAPAPAQVASLPPAGEIADAKTFKARWPEVLNQVQTDYSRDWRYIDNASRLEEILDYDKVEVSADRITFRMRYNVQVQMGSMPFNRVMTSTVVVKNAWPFEVIDIRK